MAVKEVIGGIQVNDHQLTTVMSVERLLRLTLSGMAFEQDAAGSAAFSHLDDRVAELRPARLLAQRSFYNPALKNKVVKNLETGEKATQRVPAFTESAKLRNAKGELLRYIKESYIDAPEHTAAAMPAFVIYYPEKLSSTPAPFDAGMEGEYYTFDITGLGKAMVLDGESRHYAMERALGDSGAGALSGPRKEILRRKLVTVEIHHGLDAPLMGQIFSDLNGKGVKLNANETASRDIRDPWSRATREIFHKLGVDLQASGRQVSAASQAQGMHLMFSHARVMVRALALGTFNGATSAADRTDGIDFDRVVSTGEQWFRIVLDHFETEGRDAIFTHPDYVLRTMPVKVALGLMGHAWYDTNMELRQVHMRSLSQIAWRVRPEWNNIAGKVTGNETEGYKLSAASAKEIGPRPARALTNPNSVEGKRIRPGT